MFPTSLGVIGLGAIGGSVAWRAVDAGVPRVLGYDRCRRDALAAARRGAITDLVADPGRLAGDTEFVLLAVPPRATVEMLHRIAPRLREGATYCTDVASVKSPIVAAADELGLAARFAGSHPFAGTHQRGFSAARRDRFHDAVVYVTPVAGGTEAANEVADFWTRVVGAHPVVLTAKQHDDLVAWTSHLPQAVSSALAVALSRGAPRGSRVGSGALDTTRLAAGNSGMWAEILLMNREAVLHCLEGLQPALDDLKRALAEGNGAAVVKWLEEGGSWRRGRD